MRGGGTGRSATSAGQRPAVRPPTLKGREESTSAHARCRALRRVRMCDGRCAHPPGRPPAEERVGREVFRRCALSVLSQVSSLVSQSPAKELPCACPTDAFSRPQPRNSVKLANTAMRLSAYSPKASSFTAYLLTPVASAHGGEFCPSCHTDGVLSSNMIASKVVLQMRKRDNYSPNLLETK